MDTVKSPVHRIAEFSLIDQDNQLISNAMFDGKIYVANFFFTSCPSICPKMTTNLKFVADQFKNSPDIFFISHSVTPWIDSVARLNQFASRYKIRSSQWHLVTGRKEEINMLARRSYFAEEELGLTKDSAGFVHTEHCLLIDRERRIRGIYNGTLPLEMQRLAEDIRVLIQE
ncbi:MAG: SCO family protein [Dyadobacter sp.]|uniref:SCO family protein n=1 Tax=Dyadobacter sp. TaxID=1914288 RepID=UPI003266D1E1